MICHYLFNITFDYFAVPFKKILPFWNGDLQKWDWDRGNGTGDSPKKWGQKCSKIKRSWRNGKMGLSGGNSKPQTVEPPNGAGVTLSCSCAPLRSAPCADNYAQ